MRIAIVGFAGCGKSACFKAITGKKKSETETRDPTKPHPGVVKIRDKRLEKLKTLFNPKKVTFAEIIFEDLPGFHISRIKDVDALLEVVGIFSGRDPVKDMDSMDLEFMLADLEIINKRLPGLEKEIKQEKSRQKELEQRILLGCKDTLEKNIPLRKREFAAEEEKAIFGYRFLSQKRVFVLGNVAEGQEKSEPVASMKAHCEKNGIRCVEFCAKLESEIADLDEPERDSFLEELGIREPAAEKVIEMAYAALGYITFFTVKGSETRAWPVKEGVTAIEAAGKIHSDIEKGFIKAEVINFAELSSCGSLQEARKKALLRLEGKEYKIKDGDIVDFRFSA